jgi:hypothetical protein
MRWQFSLVTLAVIVAGCAIASCALAYATTAWSSTLTTGAVVLLIFATLAVIFREGQTRAFWLGCAVSGWIYLLLTGLMFNGYRQVDIMGRPNLDSALATSHLASWAWRHLLPKVRAVPETGGGGGGFIAGEGGGSQGFGGAGSFPVYGATTNYPDEVTFIGVSHAIWLWIFTLAGGIAAKWLYATRPLKSGSGA